ncbi:MAG: site-specific integrase, partial [Desulfuromonadaceae bacterium]|nr:site-specific integrase [Desulfuromonadaceae bacterium]
WASEGYTPQLAAELRAKRIRAARHQGEVKTSRDIRAEQRNVNRPLQEIKEHYFNSTKGGAIKGKKQDLCRWNHHLAFLAGKSPRELSQLEIERIKRNMKEKELAPATIDHALRLLRRIVNHGVEHGLCPRLAFKIQFPKVNNIITEFLSPEEAARLLDTLNSWHRQDVARLVKLAMFSGLRRGELFRLKREHLNFQHSLITIAAPKGGNDVTVPMSPPVRELFEQQLAFLEDEKERRAKRYRKIARQAPIWEDHDYVFPGVHGDQRMECTAIDRIKTAADLPKHFRPFHGLRHHYAVLLASSGEFNLDQIGQLLTHKSSDITRRYAHFLPEAQQRSADRAAEIIAAQATPEKIVDKKL